MRKHGGNDGFKTVKSAINKKSVVSPKPASDAAIIEAKPKPNCKKGTNGMKCTNASCTLVHEFEKCPRFIECVDATCKKRHRFLWKGSLRVCSAGRLCTLRKTDCPYHHDDPMCSDFDDCPIFECTNRHREERKLKPLHSSIEFGVYEDGQSTAVEELKAQLHRLNPKELRRPALVDPTATPTTPAFTSSRPRQASVDLSCTDVVIALVPPKANGQLIADGDTNVDDSVFSCKLISNAKKEGSATEQVLAFTSYTPNFVDQGIKMGKLTPAVLDRASRLFVCRHEFNPARLWGSWASRLSFSTDHSISAIAASKNYDVIINKVDGVDTVRVIGESTNQPDHPLRLVNVKLSHTPDFTESQSIISRSMPTTTSTIHTSEYFKLPIRGSRMEYALVLAGAVAGWCGKKQQLAQEPTASPSKQLTMLTTHMHARFLDGNALKLSITYGGFEKLKSTIGKYVHRFASNFFNNVCEKNIDPSRAVCISQTVQPNDEQLRQLRTIAGWNDGSTYEDVADRLSKLGFAATEVARSVGCTVSERHILLSESHTKNVLQCTTPTRYFISCYNQFIILDKIDPNSSAAVARNSLLTTLHPLSKGLAQWTACRDKLAVTSFKCGIAIKQCMAKLTPTVKVPVKAIVARPPKDGYITSDGTITVFVPDATPPSCEKSPSVIITIPASCVRDKDGNTTNAFDMTTCAVGRTVMLMVSLDMLSKLTNGMTVTGDGGVTLVPEIPLSLVPKWFGKNSLASDDDYDQIKPAQSIHWED
jgi:hypothetical protein